MDDLYFMLRIIINLIIFNNFVKRTNYGGESFKTKIIIRKKIKNQKKIT